MVAASSICLTGGLSEQKAQHGFERAARKQGFALSEDTI